MLIEFEEVGSGILMMINIYGYGVKFNGYLIIVLVDDSVGLLILWVVFFGFIVDFYEFVFFYVVSDFFLVEGFVYIIDVSIKLV